MLKVLLGGSPCTNWSIAQTRNRETRPEGMGWELFKNYLIAREKFKPDFFLYENNKSMAPAIREQIAQELCVEPILINSALVSAQNRQRLYWTNIPGVKQPEDHGIILRDILESSATPICCEELAEEYYQGGLYGSLIGMIINPSVCRNGKQPSQQYRVYSCDGKSVCVDQDRRKHYIVPVEASRVEDGKLRPVYEVRGGQITINGQQYPIKLMDGYYVIRKLTITECKRLQTVPEEYIFPVSDTQAYKMLGNGWTVDVITHILHYAPGITGEPMEVLSMYDGMSCGRLALNKLGANVVRYYATEIDKHAIKTTQTNFPDTIQLGDAFRVRDGGWRLPKEDL